MSAGSWGVVHESNASGALNTDILAGTTTVLVDTVMFHAVSFEPQAIQVRSPVRAADHGLTSCWQMIPMCL